MQRARNPTLAGLLEFAESDALADVLDKKSWRGRIGVVRRIMEITGAADGTIIDGNSIDEICTMFAYRARGRYYAKTITSYQGSFRTTAIMYHRWHSGELDYFELRATRTIIPCDTHSDTTFYPDNGLVIHHLKLSDNSEVTLKLPAMLLKNDAATISNYVDSLVYDQSLE